MGSQRFSGSQVIGGFSEVEEPTNYLYFSGSQVIGGFSEVEVEVIGGFSEVPRFSGNWWVLRGRRTHQLLLLLSI